MTCPMMVSRAQVDETTEARMRPVRDFDSESPTVEVVVFRDGREVARELCDVPEDATLVVERWSEDPGVVCQVDDLSERHRPEDIRDPSPDEPIDDEYRVNDYRVDEIGGEA
jgi:hypothetical protein